jgi:hypothetical protein
MHGDKTMNMLSFSAGATDNGHKNEDNMPDKEGGEDNSSTPEKVVLEISVTDTGIGMPADRLPRLFKSFSQIDISTARRYGGTGLGLAISSMLVNRMDGGLWVESEEGVGSRFSSALPLIISSDRGEDGKENESTHSSNIIASPPSPSSTTSDGSVSLGSSIYSDRVLSEVPSSNLFSPSSSPNNGFLSSCNQISNSQQDTKPNKENDSLASDSLKVGLSVYTTTPTTAHSSWEPIMNRIPPSEPYSAENNNSELQNMISKYNKDPNSPSTYLFNTNSTPNSNTNHNNNILSKSSLEMPPVTSRVPRVTISKQSHYGRKPSHSKEENLALTYPVKIMLAEDNVCKFIHN